MAIVQEDELKQSVRRSLCAYVISIRDRRRYIEQKMLSARQAYMNTHLDTHWRPTDSDTSNYSTPFGRRTHERTIARVVKMLTPRPKWHEVEPMAGSPDEDNQDKLSNVDAFMTYVLRKRIRSRSNISQLSRCCILYGMPVLKTSIQVVNGQVWPTQRAVDPFAFYLYPETSPTTDQADIVFEDFMLSFEKYNAMAKQGMWDPIMEGDVGSVSWPYYLVERLAYQGITHPLEGGNWEDRKRQTGDLLQKTMHGYLSMTEVWQMRDDKLYQIYICWNIKSKPGGQLVGFFQSRYDQPLYRMSVHRPLPGETYTNSQGDDIAELDNIQVDLFNQFMSALHWEQGIVLDGTGGRSDKRKMKGRERWEVDSGDPREMFQFLQPPNTSNNFLKAWQIAIASIQSMGGSGSIAEGQPGRNMPRAGFAMNNLINLGLADVSDVAEMIEQEILTPGLSDIYKVAHFIPDSQLIKIPGGSAIYGERRSSLMYKSDIVPGDYEFNWVGSLEFQDVQQQAQNLMMFGNMMAQPPILQQLAQVGMQPNFVELFQMMWRYTLGQRGLNKIIIPAPPPPQPAPPPPVTEDNPLSRDVEAMQAQRSGRGGTPPGGGGGMPQLNPPQVPSPVNGMVRR